MIEWRYGYPAWGALESVGGFLGLAFFCVCFGIGDECLQDWMEQAGIPMSGAAADATGLHWPVAFNGFWAGSRTRKLIRGCFALAILPVT